MYNVNSLRKFRKLIREETQIGLVGKKSSIWEIKANHNKTKEKYFCL